MGIVQGIFLKDVALGQKRDNNTGLGTIVGGVTLREVLPINTVSNQHGSWKEKHSKFPQEIEWHRSKE